MSKCVLCKKDDPTGRTLYIRAPRPDRGWFRIAWVCEICLWGRLRESKEIPFEKLPVGVK